MPDNTLDRLRRRFQPLRRQPARELEFESDLDQLEGLPPVGGKRPTPVATRPALQRPQEQPQDFETAPTTPGKLSRPTQRERGDDVLDASLGVLEG